MGRVTYDQRGYVGASMSVNAKLGRILAVVATPPVDSV